MTIPSTTRVTTLAKLLSLALLAAWAGVPEAFAQQAAIFQAAPGDCMVAVTLGNPAAGTVVGLALALSS